MAGAGLATESPNSTMASGPGSRSSSFSLRATGSGRRLGAVGAGEGKAGAGSSVTLDMLERLNVTQSSQRNKEYLDSLGGLPGLAALLGVDLQSGLTDDQAKALRLRFGANVFPSPPMCTWIELFVDALKVRCAAWYTVCAGWSTAGWMSVYLPRAFLRVYLSDRPPPRRKPTLPNRTPSSWC